MSMTHLSDRVSEACLRSSQFARSRYAARLPIDEPRQAQAFSIAISREAGTRDLAIAEAVGRRLNWSVYDQRLLELIASAMHVGVRMLDSVDERHVGWLQCALEDFSDVPRVGEYAFAHTLADTLLSLAARGECVILGRGAAFVLPANSTLRVRLVAHIEDRIAFVCHEHRLSRSDARQFIEKIDRERTEFVQTHFRHDPADVANYDLVLNTGRMTIGECAELVVDALGAKQQACLGHKATQP